MSEHDNDSREVIDEEDKDADVVEVTGDTTVDPSVADPNNDKKDDYEDICYICRRPESVAGKMIHIPNNICICNDCMQKTFDSMEGFGFGSGDNASLNNIDFSKMPNISMVNLSDLSDFMPNMPNSQRLKKKKKKEDKQEAPVLDIKNIPPPHKIKAELDEYVVGQEYAKKVMSVAVYNHYKRVATGTMDEIEIEKSNMLMIGPTGSGKTYLVKILARLLDVPLAITDATSLTEAGYIGDDIESVVSKLLAAADNDVEKAERGIIFIDEIDKLAKKKNTNQRDVSGESVQQGMLKLLEGAEVEVPVGASSKNAMVPMTIVDTKNILFICGGAFPDLDSIIKERLNKASSMGFMADLKDKYDKEENILMKATVEDLKNFGMIPEFLGRLPILFSLEALDEDMLVRILKEPKNSLTRQYHKLFELDGVDLEFKDEALELVARKSLERKTGARGLRSIMEKSLMDLMYRTPSDDTIRKCVITKEVVEGTGEPEITYGEAPAQIPASGRRSSRTRKKGTPETA